jgi:hypothetical protein
MKSIIKSALLSTGTSPPTVKIISRKYNTHVKSRWISFTIRNLTNKLIGKDSKRDKKIQYALSFALVHYLHGIRSGVVGVSVYVFATIRYVTFREKER